MNKKTYRPVDSQVNFPAMEEKILQYWNKECIFEKSMKKRQGNEKFVFYDGPPFATGLPHFGHFVPGTLKDIFPRYQTMKGKYVVRRFGWDCHGLPVEHEIEKDLGISGHRAIRSFGIERFNDACRSIVLRFTSQWRSMIERMGRWVDFENDYKTMDPKYMESIWWVFKKLYERDLIYSGFSILPYSAGMATPLSNFEVSLGGYQNVRDPAITVKFHIKGSNHRYFLAWTTTPWTLPSNLALGLGADIEYVEVCDKNEYYILGKSSLRNYYSSEHDYTIIRYFTGKELAGLSYDPLFPYFSDLSGKGAFKVHVADYINTDEGTGIVHIAPGFGEDDFQLLKDTNLPVICPIDDDCRFKDEVKDFAGLFVKTADQKIIEYLKGKKLVVRYEQYLHSYPFCYRTHTPIIYRAISSWFVRVEKIKERMQEINKSIQWIPMHIREGRFGKWLEGARDWAISRNRYWGNPIPIWESDESGYRQVIGSLEELTQKSGVQITDLHKHVVDKLYWPSPDGKGTMRRVPEVLDCWFESGAMPYAQLHYPFESKDEFHKGFPADFICEGLDQTRGWFYTLTVLSTALFQKPAFKNVVVNGLILNKDMKKMSKSQRNYTDPKEVITRYGADALRIFLMHSVVVQGEDLKYSDEGVEQVLRSVLIPLWNAYSFFVIYANLDDIVIIHDIEDLSNPLDIWIISELEKLIEGVTHAMDCFMVKQSLDFLLVFIDMLNNWYIRRSRRRFWKSESDSDKQYAYETLFYVLIQFCKVVAPIVPFISEEIYRNLRSGAMEESVHLCDYPITKPERRNLELEKRMAVVRKVVSMGHALRRKHTIKTRQPLQAVYLVTKESFERNALIEFEYILKEELNIKEVIFRQDEEEIIQYFAQAKFSVLGRVLGKDMKSAAKKINELDSSLVKEILEGGVLSLEVGERVIDLSLENVTVQRMEKGDVTVVNEGTLTVGLDTCITEELKKEGVVRDIVRKVQTMRKEMQLSISCRIRMYIQADNFIFSAIKTFMKYLQNETLATEIYFENHQRAERFSVLGFHCAICIDPIQ